MSDTEKAVPSWDSLSADERQSALFSNLVMQQTNAALLMLGQIPHPETGKAEVDLDGASLFIDTLEMLQVRTRGNLSKPEEGLLKQNLTMLRMTYVQKVNAGAGAETKKEAPGTKSPDAPATPAAAPAAEEESKVKFTKKY